MGKFEILRAGTSFLWKVPKMPVNAEKLRYLPEGKENFAAQLDEFVHSSDKTKIVTDSLNQAKEKTRKTIYHFLYLLTNLSMFQILQND